MHIEVLLAHPAHFGQARIVRAACGSAGRRVELRLEQRPHRSEAIQSFAYRRSDAVVGESAIAVLLDEARFLEQSEVPGYARLCNSENSR